MIINLNVNKICFSRYFVIIKFKLVIIFFFQKFF